MKAKADERPPSSGMLPGFPTARCSTCGHWSYLAAIDGRCLACVTAADPGTPPGPDA